MTTILKIAVIGSDGFIGTHLCQELKRFGHSVVRCDLPDVDITVPSSLDILEGIDVVYHLAVLPLTGCKVAPISCVNTNVVGTINVLAAVEKFKIPRLIYASASSVYGDPISMPVRESDPKDPLTIYGCCKLAAENIINVTMGNMSLNNDFKYTYGIFRFTNVYGPGQINGVIPTFIHKIKASETLEVTGNGSQSRDFVYVNDVVNILNNAAVHPLYNFAMNLGSGNQTSINDIITMLSGLLRINPNVEYIMGNPDRERFIADISLLRTAYDFDDPTSIVEGLKKTIIGSFKE